ncbi:unnamed protein product [Mytilus coruscus]|uniref:B box-type domain-containing protein n=1 Tax=Mytilus coruscus TaxID=42192 RepID=A0A6J8A3X5_MYTCO|nr:unnamed protein product [Mytilus coruscus]
MIETRTLVRECVQGYVFWSLFQGLGPMIWFYPLNELELSGYEIFAVTFFAPVLVGIPGVLKLLQNRWMLGILRMATVGSLASFQASTTLIRLAILALGTGAAMLVFTVTLWSKDSRIRCHTFWGIILGFMSFVTSRVWFVSFVPTWWSIGAIAALDHIISGADISEVKESPSKTIDRPYWLPTAIGFGSLLYLTHWCFGESSLVLRWVVKGYPDHGPAPYPWGSFILIDLGLGVLIMSWSWMTKSKIWWIVGLISILILYYLPTWIGFMGGLALSIFTMSIWPVLVDRMTLCPPARSMFVVMVTYLVQIFFFVWTVAYNFVPGGVYTREHTDYLIAAVMIGIFIGMFIGGEYNSHTAFPCDNKKQVPFNKIRTVTVLIVCIGLLGYGMRYSDNQIKQPEKKNEKEFSAAIWTFHFGYDNKGWPSMDRAAKLFKDTDIGKQEGSNETIAFSDVKCVDHCGQSCCLYCDTCNKLICFKCITKVHNGHEFIEEDDYIKGKVEMTPKQQSRIKFEISKEYTTDLNHIHFIAVCSDGSMWMGDGFKSKLQHVILKENRTEIILSRNTMIYGMAKSHLNNILVTTGETKVKLINTMTGQLTDSRYDVKPLTASSIHVTSDHRVIIGAKSPGRLFPATGRRVVIAMDPKGQQLKEYEHDNHKKQRLFNLPRFLTSTKHNKRLFTYPKFIASTSNGNICVVDWLDDDYRSRVVVLSQGGDILGIYTGHPDVNTGSNSFIAQGILTTPLDNIVLTDLGNHLLHILTDQGQFITYFNLRDMGIIRPCLALSTSGTIFLGCRSEKSSPETTKAKLYELEYSGF